MLIKKDDSAKIVITSPLAEVITPTVYTTTSSFADVTGSIIDAATAKTIAITIANTGGANAISYKILASVDGTTYVQIVGSTDIAFGANDTYSNTAIPYRYYKVQAVDKVGGSHSTVQVAIIAK